MKNIFGAVFFKVTTAKLYFTVLLFLAAEYTSAQKADIILTNGKIFTGDSSKLYVEALAISGDKVLATGSNQAIERTATSKTKRINLNGKTVVPGFNDAHDHPGWEAGIGKSYEFRDWNTKGQITQSALDSVASLVKAANKGEWITGFIGTTVFFDSTMRDKLDSIAPDNPVALFIYWGHGAVVNQKALEAAGLKDTDQDPVGGWYIRSPLSNKISGLQQNAQAAVWIALSKSNPGKLIDGLRVFAQQQLRGGITSVQFMGTGFDAGLASLVFSKANLQQHIRIIRWPRSTASGRQLSDWNEADTSLTPMSYISGIKYVIDGTPIELNALRTIPYPEKTGWYGRLNYSSDTLNKILSEALISNRQLMMHITADSSFGIVLSMMQKLGDGPAWRAKRVRIEHNCVGDLTGNISASHRQVLKDLGIIMMHTPKYCMASPVRSLLEKGIVLGISPDGTINPFVEIMQMTSTHNDVKENLSIEQAVIAYTRTNAFAEFAEHKKGTLVRGMLADLAVLSQDIFSVASKELPATTSLLTIVSGKIVYSDPENPIFRQ